MNNYSHTILKTEYNKDTGVIIDQEKYRKVNKSKGGWRRMYKDYTTAQEECIAGKSDLKVWNYIIDNTKSDFSFTLNKTKVAKKIGTTRQTIHSLMKRMIDKKIIRVVDEGYEFNPLIYCPFGANDSFVSEKQLEWKEYIKNYNGE